jgi:hypothetical protein
MLAVGLILMVSLVALGIALSGSHHSQSDYAPFADCPLSNPATDVCIFAQTESGRLIIGKKTIPITRAITLQGGVHENVQTGKQEFVGAADGDALSRALQAVPGGLLEIVAPKLLPRTLRERFYAFVDQGVTNVTATVELAAPASSIRVSTQDLIEAKAVGLSLPVKVKLSNPFLGASCYIGSNAHPIVIPLTTGTTSRSPLHKPITGKPGHAKFEDDYNLITIKEDSLISNSFAAPRAEGCGGARASLVDLAVDAELGVPVAAGHNEMILNGALRDANAPAVKASR